jgi:uroporphyrinogen-III synthase
MLNGKRIALLERRQHREFALLVEKLGGVPVIAPAMDEVVSLDDYHTFIDGLLDGRFSIAILLSGVGFVTLMKEVERRGRLHPVLDALRQLTLVCRGAKPLAALTAYKLKPQVTTAKPHTTRELERALATIDVDGRGVALIHSGERNTAVAEGLRARGSRLLEVFPYERTRPDNQGPLAQVVRDVIAGRIDVMLFTNQSQCQHLFEVAREMSQAEGLALSLRQSVVVGAVGPVSARALERAGIVPNIVPRTANMPALLHAVVRYFENQRSE